MNKVKQMPRFTRTMKGVPLPVGGFQPSDIPALQRGTEWMVSQCHKAMTKVKKRYLHGQYCIDDPDWKQLDTNPQSLQATGRVALAEDHIHNSPRRCPLIPGRPPSTS